MSLKIVFNNVTLETMRLYPVWSHVSVINMSKGRFIINVDFTYFQVMEGTGTMLVVAVGPYSQHGIILALLTSADDDDDDGNYYMYIITLYYTVHVY